MASKGGGGRTVATKALTTRFLESLKPAADPYRIKDQPTRGLSIRVAASGVLTWYVATRVKGAATIFKPIGEFPAVGLQEARDRTNEITKAARAGRNLLAEEEEARIERTRAYTVEQLIGRYVAKRVRGRLRTAEDIERRLIRALAPIKKMRADEVRRRNVRDLLDEVAEDGREREAEKRRQVIGAMFRWAIGKDILENDPTAGIPVYDPGTPRERVLAEDEIKSLLNWLASGDAPPDHADVLRLQLLLGSRVGEVAGMMAGEIDRQTWVWTLPGERSKNGRPRATPLLGWARQIVENKLATHDRGALFRTERDTPLSSTSMAAWLRSARLRGRVPIDHFGTHDLRRTVASQMDEMGIARDVIGALIGHESGDRGVTVLRRHYLKSEGLEKKKAALQAWEARLGSIAKGRGVANVVALHR